MSPPGDRPRLHGAGALPPMNPWTVLTSVKRTSVALERRADDLLRARALQLTQLRLLIDIEDRHAAYSGQLAKDLLMSRQAVHHQLAGLWARGALRTGPAGNHVRRVRLHLRGARPRGARSRRSRAVPRSARTLHGYRRDRHHAGRAGGDDATP